MDQQQLILTPSDPYASPSQIEVLKSGLRQLGLLGESFTTDKRLRYFIGNRFLQLISFLGCSPHVEIAPPHPGSLDFCHLHFMGPLAKPRFLYGSNLQAPSCPSCRKRLADWRSQLDGQTDLQATTLLPCPHCEKGFPLVDLNWRRAAGSGVFFLLVEGIFPQEAIPTPELLTGIQQLSALPWNYFYVRD